MGEAKRKKACGIFSDPVVWVDVTGSCSVVGFGFNGRCSVGSFSVPWSVGCDCELCMMAAINDAVSSVLLLRFPVFEPGFRIGLRLGGAKVWVKPLALWDGVYSDDVVYHPLAWSEAVASLGAVAPERGH